MAVKFKIVSRLGTYIIDDTYRNMSFVRKFNVLAGTEIRLYLEETYTGATLFAFKCQNETFIDIPNILWTSEGRIKPKGVIKFTQDVTVYEFADINLTRAAFGLNIRRTDGTLLFSSSMKPLRVVEHVAGAVSSTATAQNIYSANLPSGRQYALCINASPLGGTSTSGSNYYYLRTLAFKANTSGSTSVRFAERAIYDTASYGYNGTYNGNPQYSFQVIDVTNY